MLTALFDTRQNDSEARRVWYFSNSLDMFAWFDEHHALSAFDLTYRTRRYQERTVSWHRERGYRHWKPIDGRQRFGNGGILVQDGEFDRRLVAAQFLAQCVELSSAVSSEVLTRLAAFKLTPCQPAVGRAEEDRSDATLAGAPERQSE